MILFSVFILVCGSIYEDSDSLIVDNDSLLICGIHSYTLKVAIRNNSKLSVRLWDGADSTGWLYLNANAIMIESNSSIQGSGAGYRGGNNSHPHGYGTGYGHAGSTSGGGGGGAGYGGNGGDGGDLFPGMGGSAYGNASDTLIDMGSGGGAGRLGGVDGFGGGGGAKIYLRGFRTSINASSLLANGERGYDGSMEGGGAGSGGGIMVWCDTIAIHNSVITAQGGNGGDGSELGGGGGGAGGGRIKLFYAFPPDTSSLVMNVQGGLEGSGGYGAPEPGDPGSIHIGPIVGIEEIAARKPLNTIKTCSITRGMITITLDHIPAIARLYDISGRCAKEVVLQQKMSHVSFHNLPQGIYFLTIDKELSTKNKIVLIE